MSFMEQLLNEEYAWSDEIVKKHKKQTVLVIMPLVLLFIEGGILAIAVSQHGTTAEIIRNLLVGLGLFAFCLLWVVLLCLLPNGARSHVNFMRRKMTKQLADDAVREDFSRQMVEKDAASFLRIKFKKDSLHWLVDFSRDYVFARNQGGTCTCVRLNDVEGIQVDKSGGMPHLLFFYKGNKTRGQGTWNEVPDELVLFLNKEMIDAAVEFLGKRGGR